MKKVIIEASVGNGKSYTINMLIKVHISKLIDNEDKILIIDPNREILHSHGHNPFIFNEDYATVKSRIKYMAGNKYTNFTTLISLCHEDILSNKFKYIFIDCIPITDAEKELLKYYQNSTSNNSMMFITSSLPRKH